MINNEIILIIVVLVQLTMMYFSELHKVAHLFRGTLAAYKYEEDLIIVDHI